MDKLTPLTPPSATAQKKLIEELHSLRNEIKTLKAREDIIVSQLWLLGEEVVFGTKHKAIFTVKYQERIDTPKLRAAFGSSLAPYFKPIQVKSITIMDLNEVGQALLPA